MSRLAADVRAARRRRRAGARDVRDRGRSRSRRGRATILLALARAGADVIEVGVPFSDPIADGPAIQRASERALAAGSHLGASLDLVGLGATVDRRRRSCSSRMSIRCCDSASTRSSRRAAAAGVDGVLLLDLPIEEAEPVRRGARRARHRSDLSREPDDDRRPAARGGATRTRIPVRDFPPGRDRHARRRRRERAAARRAHPRR